MVIFRYFGHALLLCAYLILGTEILKYLETKTIKLITVEQAWMAYSSDSWGKFKDFVTDGFFPVLWMDLIEPAMGVPLLMAMGFVSLFLVYISRHSDLGN